MKPFFKVGVVVAGCIAACLIASAAVGIRWTVLSAFGVGVAVTGLTAAALFAIGSHAAPSPLAIWAGLSVLRILVAPLLALLCLVCAVLSRYRFPRLSFLAAAVVEAAVSAYGGFVWFVPLFFPER